MILEASVNYSVNLSFNSYFSFSVINSVFYSVRGPVYRSVYDSVRGPVYNSVYTVYTSIKSLTKPYDT